MPAKQAFWLSLHAWLYLRAFSDLHTKCHAVLYCEMNITERCLQPEI